ncbi:site-specific integrase [Xylella taiwanensis]|uniref:Integrase n=2 Tax=Xylella taiwanensis TaxID=1444770 RepID=Z9JIH1_9GAMM|nr:site-specific integrase [Xylella taiwanensis]AXI83462.1 integrase [Xylella taiwanensis]EWS77974.1 integrase [Xylella taiwanensis]MCD8456537.1 site-specific integrase [Xylella taiwanensis]MCD8458944.1 site-specific integrase [Xylella taiwanensis]MCD8461082.1 site-specific integrase [Xylella taiwanensis]
MFNYVWEQAATRWLVEKSYKATAHEDAAKLRWLAPHLARTLLIDIDGDFILRVAMLKANQTTPATANRYLALIRSILRRACDIWRWIDRCPAIALFPEPSKRVRWLTPAQVRSLLAELPLHQRDIVVFALATGLRQANVLKLHWHQVDIVRKVLRIPADQAKGRQAIRIPLSVHAVGVLQRQYGQHGDWVFTYRGQPIRGVNTRAWRHALQRAGIGDFRWHDLRHTWASWHAQAGTPLYVLQELGGWQSESMVRRYAHLTPSHFSGYAEAMLDSMQGKTLLIGNHFLSDR